MSVLVTLAYMLACLTVGFTRWFWASAYKITSEAAVNQRNGYIIALIMVGIVTTFLMNIPKEAVALAGIVIPASIMGYAWTR